MNDAGPAGQPPPRGGPIARPLSRRLRLLPICAAFWVSIGGPTAQAPGGAFPERLEQYLTRHVKITVAQRTQLLKGLPITRILEGDPALEVSVFGAVWVDAPIARFVAAQKDIEAFERGENFRVTRRISSPPRIEDFAELDLPADDVADLRTCRVGRCEIQLSEATLDRLRREVDFSQPTAFDDVEALARRLMLEFATGYLEGGNAKLAVYRDGARPTFVADEFKALIDRMPALSEQLPELRTYLLDFPKAKLPNATSFLYWQEARFGLKPTIRINHVVIDEQPTHVAVASKMLYASHYFWTALEFRVLVPDPSRGQGFWFVSVNRSRSDGLGGFVGRLLRGRVRSEAENGMMAALKSTKTRLESGN